MKTILLFILLCSSSPLFSQSEKKYFQQKVDFDIEVTLDDEKHELIGFEKIIYTNNSPHTLDSIYFHLWPNAYKNYNSALGKQQLENNNTVLYYAPEKHLGFIDSLQFKTGKNLLKWNLTPKNEDICIVYLLKPLKPGESVTITTPFRVKIPSGKISRLGHIGQSYQITQWFPKPAVYDLDGWHPMPYLDQGEFYSEYGTFDVHLTLPENYVVGATGDLVNGKKELNWLNKKAIQTQKMVANGALDSAYKIKNGMDFPASSEKTKTLHFHQKNIHDFAWFADKRYHVLKGEIQLPHTQKMVTTWAMFTNNEADLWQKSIEYLNDATYYYSLWNGDYPYNQVTAVDGSISAGGGMEYPNVTVIGESYDAFTLETTIMHEVGHNWFYGIFGTNERDHGWMDEGLNTMNENRYIEKKYPNSTIFGKDDSTKRKILGIIGLGKYKHKTSYEIAYLINAKTNKDQAISTHSADLTSFNYGGITYSKTGIVFDYLMAYLGEETYDKCMLQYFETWKFKHPQPKDLRTIFESETGKDLSWFFDGLINTTDKIDYKITGVKQEPLKPDSVLLKLQRKAKINGPFSVSGIKDGKIVNTQWYEPIGKKKTVLFPKGDYDKYRIDAALNIPEINRKNNTLKANGLFKTVEPLRLQFGASLENPDKTQLFFTPIAGWNMNDKAMLGMAFYNSVLPKKRFEYVIAPLYAFNSENVNGYVSAFYNIHPNFLFQNIKVGSDAASFSYKRVNSIQNTSGREILTYYKVAPSVKFIFKKKQERQQSTIYLALKNNTIFEEEQKWYPLVDGTNEYNLELTNYYINQVALGIDNKNILTPYNANLELQQSNNFIKLNLTANIHFAYKKPKTGFDIRVFVGNFLTNNNADSRFNYGLSGNSDYLYENIFLDRSKISSVLNQQFAINDGGFKHYTTGSNANNWLTSVNVKSNLLSKHLSLYAGFGWVGLQSNNFTGKSTESAYETGIALNIVPKVFEIYFPIKLSSDLNQLNYGEKIRFTLNLNTLNPFNIIEQIGF